MGSSKVKLEELLTESTSREVLDERTGVGSSAVTLEELLTESTNREVLDDRAGVGTLVKLDELLTESTSREVLDDWAGVGSCDSDTMVNTGPSGSGPTDVVDTRFWGGVISSDVKLEVGLVTNSKRSAVLDDKIGDGVGSCEVDINTKLLDGSGCRGVVDSGV